MSEVIVKFDGNNVEDGIRLTEALDAFAKWCEETGECDNAENALDFMMTTERTGSSLRRKLIFQNRSHAAKFLVFWRSQNFPTDQVA